MLIRFKVLLPFIIGALLLGCASSAPIYSESFIADVNQLQMRQFHLQVEVQAKEPATERRNGARQSAPTSADRRMPAVPNRREINALRKAHQRLEAFMEQRLLQILTDTQFCTHGFFIIEKRFSASTGALFGECKAVAPTDT